MNLPALHSFVPRLRRWAFECGLTDRAARRQAGVRMLMHHGIGGVYKARAFEEQLAWIKDNHAVLPMDEAVARLRSGRALPAFAIVLTFDDGLRNNLTEAYPLLVKHQVPATFFVCPGLIDTGRWIWTYEMRERLKTLNFDEFIALARQVCVTRFEAIDEFLGWMKKLPNPQRHRSMEAVRAATPRFQATEQHHRDHDLMSWADLQSLDKRLITVGSHTMTHPILSSLNDEEIETELKDSKAALLARGLIREQTALLCYPDGAHDDRVTASASRHYAAACSTKKGIVTATAPLFCLPRIGANSRIEDVSWRLWRPGA